VNVALVFACSMCAVHYRFAHNAHIRQGAALKMFKNCGVPQVGCISTESCKVQFKIWQKFIDITIFNQCPVYYYSDFVSLLFIMPLYSCHIFSSLGPT
jgi:hypothetical protein